MAAWRPARPEPASSSSVKLPSSLLITSNAPSTLAVGREQRHAEQRAGLVAELRVDLAVDLLPGRDWRRSGAARCRTHHLADDAGVVGDPQLAPFDAERGAADERFVWRGPTERCWPDRRAAAAWRPRPSAPAAAPFRWCWFHSAAISRIASSRSMRRRSRCAAATPLRAPRPAPRRRCSRSAAPTCRPGRSSTSRASAAGEPVGRRSSRPAATLSRGRARRPASRSAAFGPGQPERSCGKPPPAIEASAACDQPPTHLPNLRQRLGQKRPQPRAVSRPEPAVRRPERCRAARTVIALKRVVHWILG